MVGLPRAGKSTFYTREIIIRDRLVRINGDNIRLALTGQRFNPNIEEFVSAIKYTSIKAHLLANEHVLVDGTHTSMSSIRKIESLVSKEQIVWIHLNTPKEICIIRAKNTGQDDLIPIIEKMSKQLESVKEYLYKTYYGEDGTKIIKPDFSGQLFGCSFQYTTTIGEIEYINEQTTVKNTRKTSIIRVDSE
jgi:predicted kinase